MKDLIVASILFLLLDSVYLNTMKPHFDTRITKIQGNPIKFRLSGAIMCYAFLLFGLYHFILKEKRSVLDAFYLGLVIYSVYESTNYAIIENWELWSVAIDSLWGGILFALTTYLTYNIF